MRALADRRMLDRLGVLRKPAILVAFYSCVFALAVRLQRSVILFVAMHKVDWSIAPEGLRFKSVDRNSSPQSLLRQAGCFCRGLASWRRNLQLRVTATYNSSCRNA